MALTLDLNTDKDGEVWNLSSLPGWLATSTLRNMTSLACQDHQGSQGIFKGMISNIQPRGTGKCVVRTHCSCQGMVVDGDIAGQLKCEKCQTKGMVEMTSHDNALKVFKVLVYGN